MIVASPRVVSIRYAYAIVAGVLLLTAIASMLLTGECRQDAICRLTPDGGCEPGPCDRLLRLHLIFLGATSLNLLAALVGVWLESRSPEHDATT